MYPKKFRIPTAAFIDLALHILGDLSEVSAGDQSLAQRILFRCTMTRALLQINADGARESLMNNRALQYHSKNARGSVLRFSYDKNIRPFVPQGHGYTQESHRRELDHPLLRDIQSTMEAFFDARSRAGGRCWLTLHGIVAMGAARQHEMVIEWSLTD